MHIDLAYVEPILISPTFGLKANKISLRNFEFVDKNIPQILLNNIAIFPLSFDVSLQRISLWVDVYKLDHFQFAIS